MAAEDPWGDGALSFGASPVSGLDGSDSSPVYRAPRLTVPTRPPVQWLAGSALCGAVGAVIALVWGEEIVPTMIGWLLSGPVALLLLAVFTWRETERCSHATHVVVSWTPLARTATLVLALVAVLGCAVRIAIWAGRNLRIFG